MTFKDLVKLLDTGATDNNTVYIVRADGKVEASKKEKK